MTLRRFSPRVVVALSFLIFIGTSRAVADLVTTNSTAETTLEIGNANRNRGSDILVVGNSGGPMRRHSVLAFVDMMGLLGAGHINSATLSLRVETPTAPAPAELMGVFAVTTAWTEGIGTSAQVNTPFGATWNSAKREGADGIGEAEPGDTDGPTQWTTPGGDFVGTTGVQATSPFATGVISGNFYTFDVTNLVTAWYEGTIGNKGLMVTPLTNDELVFSRVSFRTSDQASPPGSGSFPRLDIDFTAVPEAGAWLMVSAATAASGLGVWRRRPSKNRA